MLRLLWLSTVATAIIAVCQADPVFDPCFTSACDRVGDILDNQLNYRVHPCDDFRQHTCSRDKSSNSPVDVAEAFKPLNSMEGNDMSIFRNILEDRLAFDKVTKALEHERKIFASCVNYGLRKPTDKEEYNKDLSDNAKRLDFLNYPHQSGSSNEHWIGSDWIYAHKGYGYAFFDMRIVDRAYVHGGAKSRFIQIGPPADNILDISNLLTKKYDQGKSGQKSKALQDLKNFLNDLNRILPQKTDEDEDLLSSKQVKNIKDWDAIWEQKGHGHPTARISWIKSIQHVFTEFGFKLENKNNNGFSIIVMDEKYFYDLAKLLSENNVVTIENYVHLRYISKTIGLVDSNYLDYSVIPTTKLQCTPGLFVGTANAYAKKQFPLESQNKLKDVYAFVVASILNHLGSVTHNAEAASTFTRGFLRKLERANVMYGYPEWLMNDAVLNNLFPEKMPINERYFINEETTYKYVLKHNLNAYVDHTLPIIDINQLFKAFTSDKIEIFERDSNDIVLPVRLFSSVNFPFFSDILQDPMNYGSAAVLLATEIYYHWLDKVADGVNITECMTHYLPRGKSLNHAQKSAFQRRAIAYLLGLRTAYEVWPNKNSLPIEFSNFGAIYDSRLFFLSFAETLCMKPIDQLDNIDTDFVKSDDYINAIVSNLEEFQEAFVCDKKSNMNRVKTTCIPWKKKDK